LTAAALAAAVLLTLPMGGALATTGELDVEGLQPIADSQLATMRGGFNLGGVQISFGVIMETLINGGTHLRTEFNLDTMSTMTTVDGAPAVVGETYNGFTLSQTPTGGFVLTNADGTLTTLQQVGNMGGGIVAAISNALPDQVIQQTVTMNVGIQNMSTIMGLTTIGAMVSRVGPGLIR
jgi:hypothetical protein